MPRFTNTSSERGAMPPATAGCRQLPAFQPAKHARSSPSSRRWPATHRVAAPCSWIRGTAFPRVRTARRDHHPSPSHRASRNRWCRVRARDSCCQCRRDAPGQIDIQPRVADVAEAPCCGKRGIADSLHLRMAAKSSLLPSLPELSSPLHVGIALVLGAAACAAGGDRVQARVGINSRIEGKRMRRAPVRENYGDNEPAGRLFHRFANPLLDGPGRPSPYCWPMKTTPATSHSPTRAGGGPTPDGEGYWSSSALAARQSRERKKHQNPSPAPR